MVTRTQTPLESVLREYEANMPRTRSYTGVIVTTVSGAIVLSFRPDRACVIVGLIGCVGDQNSGSSGSTTVKLQKAPAGASPADITGATLAIAYGATAGTDYASTGITSAMTLAAGDRCDAVLSAVTNGAAKQYSVTVQTHDLIPQAF